MQETRVQSLGGEDPLEKGMATHSSKKKIKIKNKIGTKLLEPQKHFCVFFFFRGQGLVVANSSTVIPLILFILLYLFVLLYHGACGILDPQGEIEPTSSCNGSTES